MTSASTPAYDPAAVEADAQARWAEDRVFEADDQGEAPFYCLSMFAYPSGQMHMGHVRCYTLGDVIARYQRLKGRTVLQPVGWDAFGLPAENAAIKNQVPPAQWTYANIDAMRAQFKRLGLALDWSREFATCDPSYYRWEQWMFLKLVEKGLVERQTTTVNWDPVDQTVLANEQVENGRGWRSGALIERREMPQWTLKITRYADELADALDTMDGWPEQVRAMQRNWIGRSEGVDIDFTVEAPGRTPPVSTLTVYTTRPDTFFGCTYVAVAPDHPLAKAAAEDDPALAAFRAECQKVRAAEADLATQEKLGLPTPFTARHPLTGAPLPIWVANFVLMDYGTGAVMAVPGHDERDFEFAQKYGLPIVQVVAPKADSEAAADLSQAAYTSKDGVLVNSPGFDGLAFPEAFEGIASALEGKGAGRRRVNYRLRDWGVSRQRYWGCPIPMILCEGCGPVPVPEAELPVVLPTDVVFEGVASPLKTEALAAWRKVDCPRCGAAAERETDTFDTFMESSWYYARFACADNDSVMLDERAKKWTPVDHYVGGIEHAVLHLLYSRFYHKLLRDEGLVDSDEPFKRLLLLGMVLKDGRKMSKSAGNIVSPNELIDRHGADALRTFMMFAAPPDQTVEWSDSGVDGATRFLRRLWGQVQTHLAETPEVRPAPDPAALSDSGKALRRLAHETLAKADDDFGRRLAFNTVVSAVMSLSNELGRFEGDDDAAWALRQEVLSIAVQVLSPIAPHLCHRLWLDLGHPRSVVEGPWLTVDEAALARDEIDLVVQVNGKLRGKLTVPAQADQAAAEARAREEENVLRHLEGKTLRKVIYVPGKLLNFVVGG